MAKTKKDIKFDVTSKLFKFKRLEFPVSSMAQRCIVGDCDSVYAKGNSETTFHQLPFDEVKRELWVTTIQDWNGLRPLRKDSRLKKAVVCGKHFIVPTASKWGCSPRERNYFLMRSLQFFLVLFSCLQKFHFL